MADSKKLAKKEYDRHYRLLNKEKVNKG